MDRDDERPRKFPTESTDPSFPSRLGEATAHDGDREAAHYRLRHSDVPPIEETDPNFLVGDVRKFQSTETKTGKPSLAAPRVPSFSSTPSPPPAAGVPGGERTATKKLPESNAPPARAAGLSPSTPPRGFARSQLGEAETPPRSRTWMGVTGIGAVAAALVAAMWIGGSKHDGSEEPSATSTSGVASERANAPVDRTNAPAANESQAPAATATPTTTAPAVVPSVPAVAMPSPGEEKPTPNLASPTKSLAVNAPTHASAAKTASKGAKSKPAKVDASEAVPPLPDFPIPPPNPNEKVPPPPTSPAPVNPGAAAPETKATEPPKAAEKAEKSSGSLPPLPAHEKSAPSAEE